MLRSMRLLSDRPQEQSQKRAILPVSLERSRACVEEKLPPLPPGMVRTLEINAAAYFWGHTHQWMDAETAASCLRARQYLVIGISQKAIEKTRKHR